MTPGLAFHAAQFSQPRGFRFFGLDQGLQAQDLLQVGGLHALAVVLRARLPVHRFGGLELLVGNQQVEQQLDGLLGAGRPAAHGLALVDKGRGLQPADGLGPAAGFARFGQVQLGQLHARRRVATLGRALHLRTAKSGLRATPAPASSFIRQADTGEASGWRPPRLSSRWLRTSCVPTLQRLLSLWLKALWCSRSLRSGTVSSAACWAWISASQNFGVLCAWAASGACSCSTKTAVKRGPAPRRPRRQGMAAMAARLRLTVRDNACGMRHERPLGGGAAFVISF
jgi:hypothetical protein